MGFDPYSMESEDLPPLWRALEDRDYATAAGLISEGAALDDLIEHDGSSLLHEAAARGDLKMVEFFLAHDCPVTREQFDVFDKTPLIWAAEKGEVALVIRLLEAGVNANAHHEARAGNTAIREAVREGHVEIVSLLLRAGADPTIPGWMGISAVDQAWLDVRGDGNARREIRAMLGRYPSAVRDRMG